MDLGLENKRALVTGASSGLGFGAAKSLIQEGALVVLASRSKEKLQSAVNVLGPQSSYMLVDLSDASNAKGLVEAAANKLGGLDILICNSGGPKPGGFYDIRLSDYRSALEANMLSSISLIEEATPFMELNGWGRIVAITSLWVRQPSQNLILSNAARTGLTAFIKTMAVSVASKNITANTLQPGFHETARFADLNGGNFQKIAAGVPSKSLGSPDDFGAVVSFLCSVQAKYITGASIPVDGGLYRGLM